MFLIGERRERQACKLVPGMSQDQTFCSSLCGQLATGETMLFALEACDSNALNIDSETFLTHELPARSSQVKR